MSKSSEPAAADARQSIKSPLFARVYDRVLSRGESDRMVDCRRRLLDGLAGRVIEVGPGNGPNFPHYPRSVSEVIAVEPEPYLRARAASAARHVQSAVSVVDGDAEHLPVEDASVDAVVVCQVRCLVPDQSRALQEIVRVLKPGGELRVFEHLDAENRFAHATLKAAETGSRLAADSVASNPRGQPQLPRREDVFDRGGAPVCLAARPVVKSPPAGPRPGGLKLRPRLETSLPMIPVQVCSRRVRRSSPYSGLMARPGRNSTALAS